MTKFGLSLVNIAMVSKARLIGDTIETVGGLTKFNVCFDGGTIWRGRKLNDGVNKPHNLTRQQVDCG